MRGGGSSRQTFTSIRSTKTLFTTYFRTQSSKSGQKSISSFKAKSVFYGDIKTSSDNAVCIVLSKSRRRMSTINIRSKVPWKRARRRSITRFPPFVIGGNISMAFDRHQSSLYRASTYLVSAFPAHSYTFTQMFAILNGGIEGAFDNAEPRPRGRGGGGGGAGGVLNFYVFSKG